MRTTPLALQVGAQPDMPLMPYPERDKGHNQQNQKKGPPAHSENPPGHSETCFLNQRKGQSVTALLAFIHQHPPEPTPPASHNAQYTQLQTLPAMISISVMQSLTTEDYARILHCLRSGPKTCKEVADALKLSYPRANQLLLNLAQKRTIHSPRCRTNANGRNINLWEIRTAKKLNP